MSATNAIQDKKLRAAIMLSQGLRQSEVAKELGVSVRTLQRWSKEASFKEIKNNVVSTVAEVKEAAVQETAKATVKATSRIISENYQPIFSYQDRLKLISEEYQRLETAAIICMKKIEEDSDLRAIAALVRISERKCKLLNLDISSNELEQALMVLGAFGVVPEKVLCRVHDATSEMTSKLSEISDSIYTE